MPITIRLEGVAQLRDKLGRFDRKATEEAEAIIRDVGKEAVDIAQRLAPKDTGAGAKSIHLVARGLSADIKTSLPYMVVQEYGRKPGKKPPSTLHIFGWAERHGFIGAFARYNLARSIGKRGFPAKRFMERAAKDAEVVLRQRLAKARAVMVQWWYGRG